MRRVNRVDEEKLTGRDQANWLQVVHELQCKSFMFSKVSGHDGVLVRMYEYKYEARRRERRTAWDPRCRENANVENSPHIPFLKVSGIPLLRILSATPIRTLLTECQIEPSGHHGR